MENRLKGRIVEIEKNVHQVTSLLTGIKKKDQGKYRHLKGSNGTVVTGSEYYGTTIDVKILVYDYEKCFSFDIRDQILLANDKKKVSSRILDHVIDANKGNKVVVDMIDGRLKFNPNQLDLVPQKKSKK
jgi:hypothetical protein